MTEEHRIPTPVTREAARVQELRARADERRERWAEAICEGTSGLGTGLDAARWIADAAMPVADAEQAAAVRRAWTDAADLLRDAHFRGGLTVQEIGTAMRHQAAAVALPAREHGEQATVAPTETVADDDAVTVQPEEYSVTAVPDHVSPDARVWALTVRHRGAGRWAVQRGEHACLGVDGEWAPGVKSYDRDDAWLNAHRFDLDTALRLAREAARHVTVNGITVPQALARFQEPTA